uniref:Uncharacterized protein n=1 Tax=Romanomermis culicivorax TaxID=13658 RepID=A0A915JDY6_ROMCU
MKDHGMVGNQRPSALVQVKLDSAMKWSRSQCQPQATIVRPPPNAQQDYIVCQKRDNMRKRNKKKNNENDEGDEKTPNGKERNRWKKKTNSESRKHRSKKCKETKERRS